MSEITIPKANREYNVKLALAFFFAVTIIFAGIFIFRRVDIGVMLMLFIFLLLL